eukprot:TRINITY_DN280_c0_g1_i1.p1 TRINITY_DN280_c0_g1~~TRINITY_DN280_c0_g1_i1.p1  ORF type:complete len:453 (-),score=140.91 TRINITY_DN280_c0_g1_i1:208-1566(-)
MLRSGVVVALCALALYAATAPSIAVSSDTLGANFEAFLTKTSDTFTAERLLSLPALLVYAGFAAVALAWLYEVLFVPYEKVLTIEEIEKSDDLSGLAANYGGRSRRPGDTPPPYPNGWFKVMDSRRLKVGDVLNMQFLGQHLVAFRGEGGTAYIVNAYCPHLGANLGSGGKVKGENVECPFHGWQFSGKDGRCQHIPYSPSAVPEQAHSKAWHCSETNGHLYLWFDAEGREPMWEVLRTPEIDNGEWYFHGWSEHEVKAHCQEMPENGADVAHLNFLHTPLAVKDYDLFGRVLQRAFQHTWDANWAPGKGEEAHMAFMTLVEKLYVFGIYVPGTTVKVDIIQQGPGLVFLRFNTTFGRAIVMETVTPMQPLLQKATHMIYAEWKMPRWLAKLILRSLVVQFERDVPIWNNKTFVTKPAVVKGDGPIPAFRRWYSRFYSESSNKFRGNNGLDW